LVSSSRLIWHSCLESNTKLTSPMAPIFLAFCLHRGYLALCSVRLAVFPYPTICGRICSTQWSMTMACPTLWERGWCPSTCTRDVEDACRRRCRAPPRWVPSDRSTKLSTASVSWIVRRWRRVRGAWCLHRRGGQPREARREVQAHPPDCCHASGSVMARVSKRRWLAS
jgi:hypothetical protein